MSRFQALLALLCMALVAPVLAAPPKPMPVDFFASPLKFKSAVLSPDGEHIAFTYEEGDNEGKLAVATADLSEVTAVYAFGDDRHVGQPTWANNERLLMSVWKNTGYLDGRNQENQLFIGGHDGKNRREVGTAGLWPIDSLESDPDYMLMARYVWSDNGKMQLHRLNVKTGESKLAGGTPDREAGATFTSVSLDSEDRIRIAIEMHPGKEDFEAFDDRYRFHYRPVGGEWDSFAIEPKRPEPEYQGLGFGPGDSEFYFLSNFDQASNDTMGLFKFDFQTKEINLVFRHPDVDVLAALRGPNGVVLGAYYEPGYPEHHWLYPENPLVKQRVAASAAFPGQEVSVTSYSSDGTVAAVRVRSDKNPGELYLFRDGQLKFLAAAKEDADPARLGTQEAFTMQARDGVKLYGLLTLPPGRSDQNLPMVVHPHGGPHGPFDSWGYDANVQALASNGYAVLQINFRGSGGYGQDFERSGWQKWGLSMQDDITDATQWAINEGVADPNRICISGGSYGGYASLMAVVKEPDLYQCAIPIVGVYSLPMMRKKGDIRMNPRAAKAIFDDYLGDDEADLIARSPAYHVDRIKADLLIIHGSEDVRVPFAQAKFLRDQLEKEGIPFEWMVRKEGHGFTQPDNRRDMFTTMLEFLNKHIGEDRVAAR